MVIIRHRMAMPISLFPLAAIPKATIGSSSNLTFNGPPFLIWHFTCAQYCSWYLIEYFVVIIPPVPLTALVALCHRMIGENKFSGRVENKQSHIVAIVEPSGIFCIVLIEL